MSEEPKAKCTHPQFEARVVVERIVDTGHFLSELSLSCRQCGMPMQFLGLPVGLIQGGASMSIDGLAARLYIAPDDECASPLTLLANSVATKH